MSRRLVPIAIAYDFDGTLAPGNMQEHNFIPDLGITPEAFWEEAKRTAEAHDMDEILAYMQLMIEKANAKQMQINERQFKDYGAQVELFDGVDQWFDRINEYARGRGAKAAHYIVSSGLREMIKGTPIARQFNIIFASGFRYDQHHVAKWPALAVNYTNKTQYLFRINKGIHNSYDNDQINKYMPNKMRPVPFSNIIYIGDGETDIPAMKVTRLNGGHAIAVYPKGKRGAKGKVEPLVAQGRADFALKADYTDGAEIDRVVKKMINKITSQAELEGVHKSRKTAKVPDELKPSQEGDYA